MYSVGGTLLPYVFIVPGFGRFDSQDLGRMYATPTAIPSGPGICHAHPITVRGSLVYVVLCHGTYMALRLSVSAVGTHYNSGALILECNGLSPVSYTHLTLPTIYSV